MAFETKIEDAPREIIVAALIRNRGFVCRAAHEIGIPRRTFYRRLDTLRLWPAVNELRKRRASEKKKAVELQQALDRAV
jgi:DNA-binding NtrC family response regulator